MSARYTVEIQVGEITFFERLPSTMKTQPVSEDAVVMARRNALSVQSLVKLTGVWNIFPESPNKWTQDDVQSISKTLGIQLLKHICTSLLGTSGDNHSRRSGQVSHVDNDTVNVHSSVREIEALQAKLHSTHDEDEQRALEEDITGKILWFYFRGICSEVEQRFVKVSQCSCPHVLSSQVTSDVPTRKDVREIAGIIERTPRIEPSDDMAHFQR
ncbi:hypothetical protein F5J12DRAFT_228386 [Pisolithus orientalis]|uniref:uncharacterized protein n=1 Tax=Pisolithus orientalis TaxID=936130 RepID=UPI0022254622|nr:uncharacterized protein F5J12DRAFT_228386 [Pisolithus orientalis]KAI6002302.1 hypothetical protein F5J12DRAFT_228386 [Pisolithus orientalis]